MRTTRVFAVLIAAAALAACQGNFGAGGTSMPGVNPPTNPSPTGNTLPASSAKRTSPSPLPSGDTVTYAFADGPQGLACPQVQDFSCTIAFNIPRPSPSPKHASTDAHAREHMTPTPSPSPSPTPSATPSPTMAPGSSPQPGASAHAGSSASPHVSLSSKGTQITLQLAALPNDAPKMVNPDPKAVATTALLTLRLRTDADATLDGLARVSFTLPKEQIGGRGFAIQLFQEVRRKKRTDEHFVAGFSKSTLVKNVLRFSFAPPKLTVKKGETWMIVLYGDERPSVTTSPNGSPSSQSPSSASAEASAAPSADTSPSASPRT